MLLGEGFLVGEQTPGYYETRHELHRYLELHLEFLALGAEEG